MKDEKGGRELEEERETKGRERRGRKEEGREGRGRCHD